MAHMVKRGDAKTLRWDLGRDLTAVSTARVIIAPQVGGTAAVDRNGVIDAPPTLGTVSLTLAAGDYGVGKLVARIDPYLVEIETSPGPLTHPDTSRQLLYVLQDLG